MKQLLFSALLLAELRATAQCAAGAVPPTNIQVTAIAATSATVTFYGGAGGGFLGPSCVTRISYAYAGGSPVSVPYAMPLLLTGLPPTTAITVTVVRYPANQFAAGPSCCPLSASLTFTTASAPLAAQPAAAAGTLLLAPNPAQGRTTLTLPAPLPHPATVWILDALGRGVRQQELPARATAVLLDVAGLSPGLYLVRAGQAAARLEIE